MSVSLNQYRIAIGIFDLNKKNRFKRKHKIKVPHSSGRATMMNLFVSLLLLVSTNFQAETGLHSLRVKQLHGLRVEHSNLVKYKANQTPDFIGQDSHMGNYSFNGFCTGKTANKSQQIVNGNRRSLGYKLAVWNCGRGLINAGGGTAKLNDVKLFIQNKKPHKYGLIETDVYGHLNESNHNKFTTAEVRELLKIDGYTLIFPATWDSHGIARILVYVNNDLKFNQVHLQNSHDDLPSVSLEIGLGRATKTVVHYYYREWTGGVSGQDSKASQLDRHRRHIEQWTELVDKKKNYVSLGDGNLCAMSWNNQNYKDKELAQQLHNFLHSESCHQLIHSYTRIQKYGNQIQKSSLDHIITNVPEKCSVPEISAGGDSDHMAVMVTKFSREVKTSPKTIKKRNYKNFNDVLFLNDVNHSLQSGEFNKVLNSSSPDEAAALFSGVFGSILNRHAPIKVYQVRNNYVPWLSKETAEEMKKRDKLKEEAIEEADLEKIIEYKKMRNELKTKLELEEKEHYKNKFYNKEASVGSVWNSVNDYLNTSSKSHSNTPALLTYQNRTYTSPRDIANVFNQIFINKVKGLVAKVGNEAKIEPKDRLKAWLEQRTSEIEEFELNPITKENFKKIMKKLKGNRSSGIDFIDGYSIKLASPIIEDVLIHLVNLSIRKSLYPQLWKSSKISPHFKKGEKINGENYRPVSDIVFVSKIAEAAVFEQTFAHFNLNNLWHANHHGFRPNHSTATALIQLYDLWARGAEEREFTAALLLDLSAAFDVVDHGILIEKLELYNFSPSTLQWFKSYLEDRRQYVMIESRLSDPLKVGDQGVPQGSLLGPLCFIMFYNDFPAVRQEGSSVLYADDDTDNITDADPEALKVKLQREANLSTDWVSDNKLVCSGDKTKLLVIGTSELKQSRITKNNISFNITVDGHDVSESSSEKLLGMIINDKLTWSNHLYGNEQHEGLVTKLSKRAGMIYKLSFLMPKDRLRNIAEGVFFSLLTYGIQVYGGVWGLDNLNTAESRTKAFTKEDNNKLQVIMNKVLRSLTGLPKDRRCYLNACTSHLYQTLVLPNLICTELICTTP